MSREKQMINDLIEIFDEEYGKRNLITPQHTAEKMTAKGYRKVVEQSETVREYKEGVDNGFSSSVTESATRAEVAKEIFAEIDKLVSKQYNRSLFGIAFDITPDLAKLKKKYIGKDTNVTTNTEGGE